MPSYRLRTRLRSIYDEFFDFFAGGNVLDLAAGVIIGNAFESLVGDIVLPPIGLLVQRNFANWFFVIRDGENGSSYSSLSEAQADGAVTINIGLFLQAVITFFLIVWLLFIAISVMGKLREDEDIDKKVRCRYCMFHISRRAIRCPYCTSDLTVPLSPAHQHQDESTSALNS